MYKQYLNTHAVTVYGKRYSVLNMDVFLGEVQRKLTHGLWSMVKDMKVELIVISYFCMGAFIREAGRNDIRFYCSHGGITPASILLREAIARLIVSLLGDLPVEVVFCLPRTDQDSPDQISESAVNFLLVLRHWLLKTIGTSMYGMIRK